MAKIWEIWVYEYHWSRCTIQFRVYIDNREEWWTVLVGQRRYTRLFSVSMQRCNLRLHSTRFLDLLFAWESEVQPFTWPNAHTSHLIFKGSVCTFSLHISPPISLFKLLGRSKSFFRFIKNNIFRFILFYRITCDPFMFYRDKDHNVW